MLCANCEGTEFEERDAIFYCKACDALCMGLGTTQEADLDSILPNINLLTRITVKAKASQQHVGEKPKKSLGRPWKSVEAFQFIIKQQVKALITLGADPKLDEVVFRIWASYLGKTGKAFLQNPLKAKINVKERMRDKFPATIKKPVIRKVRHFATRSQNPDLQKLQNEKKLAEAIESEDFYEGDNPLDVDPEEKELLRMQDIEKKDQELYQRLTQGTLDFTEDGTPDRKKYDKKDFVRNGYDWSDEKMTMLKTISIVYVGLQITNNEVLPHDLVRWIKEGKVPFSNLNNWPEDMNFSQYDFETFCPKYIPSAEHIFYQSGRLVNYLRLDKLPPINICHVATRFIVELGLPVQLISIVKNLLDIYQPTIGLFQTQSYRTNLEFSLIAMAYIVLVLKMIFGLNDDTERKLSEFTRYLSDHIEFRKPLFNWDDWTLFAEQQSFVTRGHQATNNLKEVRQLRNINEGIEIVQSMANTSRHTGSLNTPWAPGRLKAIDGITKSLNSLYRNATGTSSRRHNNGDDEFDEDDDEILDSPSSPTSEHVKFEKRDDDVYVNRYVTRSRFSFTSMDFVLEPYEFLTKLSDGCSDKIPESDIDASQDLFETPSNKGKLGHEERSKRPHDSIRNPTSSIQSILDDIPDHLKDIPSAPENYALFVPIKASVSSCTSKSSKVSKSRNAAQEDDYETETANRHRSYRWLLRLCSSHVDARIELLEEYLQRLELVCLMNESELKDNLKFMRSIFIKRCFAKGDCDPSKRRKVCSKAIIESDEDL